jgi:hypothetical protein
MKVCKVDKRPAKYVLEMPFSRISIADKTGHNKWRATLAPFT